MDALANRLETLRADLEAPAMAGLASLSLAYPLPGQPVWKVEPVHGRDPDGIVDSALADALRRRPWRALARDAARAGLRFLAAGPAHRLAVGPARLLFDVQAVRGRAWAAGTPLGMLIHAADPPDGRPVLLGGPPRGHARLAALEALARWAESVGLPPPDGQRIAADWWITPGAVLRRGPLVAVLDPAAPERTQIMRTWDL